MRKSLIILVGLSILILLTPYLYEKIFAKSGSFQLDVVEVNALLKELGSGSEPAVPPASEDFSFDYTVLDQDENLIFSTEKDASSASLAEATKNRDSIRNILHEGKLTGYLIIHNNTEKIAAGIRRRYMKMWTAAIIISLILWAGYAGYLYFKIIRPFEKLDEFAGNVAMGNLDAPLQMDRGNVFGAFTESFDIMREEISLARKKEYEANESKRELVVQLSHDIKTPVASIKAMSEVLEVRSRQTEDEFTNAKVKAIGQKADQIDTLVSNLFAATLSELEHLEVNTSETVSSELAAIIKTADHEQRIKDVRIPECIICMDKIRASQVVTNIIYNSYKYADTEIILEAAADEEYLNLSFSDKGGGVPDDDLPVIMNKYRRGENSKGKEGSGLGLYISRNLMLDMGGHIECENTEEGFKVTIGFKLA
ncbi:His Kinase A (phospho-acceptor) domain-containing protein [Eubacterium ruminantium]|nr:His Kinase A (phospho-acceptor) domain-containing protein [Eubacterium ruminantium]